MAEFKAHKGYVRRGIDELLDQLSPHFAAIALEGPKGVGKTATAQQRVQATLHFDDEQTRQIVAADPALAVGRSDSVLLDEWQRYPQIWDTVRRAVDNGAQAGSFYLTGSAYPPAEAQLHSGAARIHTLRMRPFAYQERHPEQVQLRLSELFAGATPAPSTAEVPVTTRDYAAELCATGFPGIMGLPHIAHSVAVDSYLQRLATHEFPSEGMTVRDPQSVIRWLTAYASATSRTDTYQNILDNATPGESNKPARSTTRAYRTLLEQLMILEPLPAWQPAIAELPAMSKSPKHHLCDPGLAAHLLFASPEELTSGDPAMSQLFARLFESFVLLSVRVAVTAVGGQVWHMRTQRGEREVDIIAQDLKGKVIGIEVKLSPIVRDDDVRHLTWLRDKCGSQWAAGLIVHAGSAFYQRPDGIWVVPLATLG